MSRLQAEDAAAPDTGEWTTPGGEPLGSLRGAVSTVTTDDGVDLHVETDDAPDAPPGGPTVLVAHGFGLSTDIWHFQRAALRGRHRLVFADQRGHGRSGMPTPGSATPERLGRDLGQVLDAAVPDGPVVLVGHSMGGMGVLALAAQRPELFGTRVTGVALVCTSAGNGPLETAQPIGAFGPLDALSSLVVSLGRRTARVSHTLIHAGLTLAGEHPDGTARARRSISSVESSVTRRMAFARPVPDDVAAFAGNVIAGTPVSVVADFYLSFFAMDLYDAIPVLRRVPTAVVRAEGDRVTPAWHGEQIAARLPDADAVLLDPAGHLAFLEHPRQVTAVIEGVVARSRALSPEAAS